jgi:hypothetical protein
VFYAFFVAISQISPLIPNIPASNISVHSVVNSSDFPSYFN